MDSNKPSLRTGGINVRLDREVHAQITQLAAHLTLQRGYKVANAEVVREAIDKYFQENVK